MNGGVLRRRRALKKVGRRLKLRLPYTPWHKARHIAKLPDWAVIDTITPTDGK
jgi:hypothetical protein